MEVRNTENISIERTRVFLKTKTGRKEEIKKQEKKEAIVNGVNTVLDLMKVPDATKILKIYPNAPKLSEHEKTEKISILISDNGIKTTIISSLGDRLDYQRSTRRLPKKASLAEFAAEAWPLRNYTSESIAAYIEDQINECFKSVSK
jgi:hypothetical protein